MKYIHRYHDYESFINDYEDDEKYIEPWVSFCDDPGIIEVTYPEVVYNKPRFLYVRLLDGENRATLYDNYTQEEKDFFNNFYDIAGIVEPGVWQDVVFSQPIKFYFVDSIDPDFDPMTTSSPFIEATNGSYYHQGSGGEHFNVPYDGNCLFLDVYNYGNGFQTIFSSPESNILGTRIFNNCG